MESPAEHPCPSCAAPARADQRWCLECGAELRRPRRAGLRPTVGIVTTLALLIGAASAGGYTLLQDGKQPPPPAQTVAQAPPATTPPAATQEPSTYTPPPSSSFDYTPSTHDGANTAGSIGGATHTTATTPTVTTTAPDGTTSVNGNDADAGGTPVTVAPQYALTDIALGAVAVAYAPYAGDDVDLGDPSRVVDGTTRTAWKTPAVTDSSVSPQAGVYVDLASPEKVRKLIVRTPTPGIGIEVYGARTGPPDSITDDGWDHLATRADLDAVTKLKLPDRAYRYVLVWVTGLPSGATRAAISELSLLSVQPE